MKKNKKIQEILKTTFFKFTCGRLFMTIICYISGVLLIDIFKMSYSVYGILTIPFTFSLNYLIERFFVFKK